MDPKLVLELRHGQEPVVVDPGHLTPAGEERDREDDGDRPDGDVVEGEIHATSSIEVWPAMGSGADSGTRPAS